MAAKVPGGWPVRVAAASKSAFSGLVRRRVTLFSFVIAAIQCKQSHLWLVSSSQRTVGDSLIRDEPPQARHRLFDVFHAGGVGTTNEAFAAVTERGSGDYGNLFFLQ